MSEKLIPNVSQKFIYTIVEITEQDSFVTVQEKYIKENAKRCGDKALETPEEGFLKTYPVNRKGVLLFLYGDLEYPIFFPNIQKAISYLEGYQRNKVRYYDKFRNRISTHWHHMYGRNFNEFHRELHRLYSSRTSTPRIFGDLLAESDYDCETMHLKMESEAKKALTFHLHESLFTVAE